jgi:hypothetical protein
MCMSSSRPPAPPAPPPPPPPPAATAQELNDPGDAYARREGRSTRARRRGTRSLRIKTTSNVGGGSGANVGY